MEHPTLPQAEPSESMGDELSPGTVLCQGQYTVVRYLNSGGFGVTYLAHDSLGRKVVIKECFPGALCCRSKGSVRLRSASQVQDFERVVAFFEREARALAQLNHPNIVGVHQIFRDNGTAYMAMDFIEGPDLFDLLECQPEVFEPPEVMRILEQLLHALAYVHNNEMLHRDISPDNILLSPGGAPILIDFGAAREGAARATRVLSRVHAVKDGYSPQEFYFADANQHKSSDLYALAATVHHLITGRAPINSSYRLAAVAQNDADPYQPLCGRVTGYDDRFLAALDRCLALFSKDRLQSAEEWLASLVEKVEPTCVVKKPGNTLSDDVKRRISELVAETSRFLETAQKSKPEPEPEPVTAAQDPTVDQAYWAILNERPEEDPSPCTTGEAPASQKAPMPEPHSVHLSIEKPARRTNAGLNRSARHQVSSHEETENAQTAQDDKTVPGRATRPWLGAFFGQRRSQLCDVET